MRHQERRLRTALVLAAALGLAAAPAGAQLKVGTFAAGLGGEFLSRTVVWGDDPAPARLDAALFGARAEFGFGRGIIVGLGVGLSLSDISALTFNTLPVSLQYDGAPLKGFSMGADAIVPLTRFSSFEIGAAGRIVYSLGMRRTWPLEGFAVEGEAKGDVSWLEAAIGPRLAYRGFDKIVPCLEITVRWLHAGMEMSETLADLAGREARRVDDLSVGVSLGAEADLGARLALRVKAGLVPYAHGVDGLVSVGVLYKFERRRGS
jgi:hypothetical protein